MEQAHIIMIQKPDTSAELAESFRPVSLLPVPSKLFEKLLLSKISIIMKSQGLIPDHQFGFRSGIEQIDKIVKKINREMEADRYCTAAFRDVSQAFDKLWHQRLDYKIKNSFPTDLYAIIKSYLL